MREELAEKYLLGRLSETEQDAFERHYFECSRCSEDLQNQRALQAELARQASAIRSEHSPGRFLWRWAWAATVAAVVVMFAAVWWVRQPTRPIESSEAPAVPAPETRQPNPLETIPPTPSPSPTLVELARVEPPSYNPPALRGAEDEATRVFKRAMKHYVAKDYSTALERLREASKLDPEAANISFYLGICSLLTGDTGGAIHRLESTIMLGDTPYLEEAHFYLAKAFIHRGDMQSAKNELEKAIALNGDLEAEARELLLQLRTLRNSPS